MSVFVCVHSHLSITDNWSRFIDASITVNQVTYVVQFEWGTESKMLKSIRICCVYIYVGQLYIRERCLYGK